MLTIRLPQMQALQHSIDQRFVQEAFSYLHNNYKPSLQKFSDEETLQLINRGLEKGRSYGFVLCKDLRSFITLTLVVSRDFDVYPSIHTLLTDEKVPIKERIDYLINTLPAREWILARDGGGTAQTTIVSQGGRP